jgi:hypothetical protein
MWGADFDRIAAKMRQYRIIRPNLPRHNVAITSFF